MAKHLRLPGSVESKAAAQSYVDVAASYMDVDGGGTFAQFGAKGPGSLGVKIRTVLAGVALTVLTFAAAGAATFGYAMSAPGITSTSGLTVSSGTSALQAITGTTYVGTSTITGTRFTANPTSGAAYTSYQLNSSEKWRAGNAIVSANNHYLIYDVINSNRIMDVTPGGSPDVAWPNVSTMTFGSTVLSGITSLAIGGAFTGATSGTFSTSFSVGPGGTGTTQTPMIMNGASGAGAGVFLQFLRNSTLAGYLTTRSVIDGSTSSDLALYATTGLAVRIYANAALSAVFDSSGMSMGAGTVAVQAITGTTFVATTTAVIGPTDPGGGEVLRATSARFGNSTSTQNLGIGWNGSAITFNIAGVGNVALWASSGVTLNYATTVNGDLTIASGQAFRFGSAYTAGVVVQAGYITVKDNTGTTYKLLVGV